jgi:hypothetical protein
VKYPDSPPQAPQSTLEPWDSNRRVMEIMQREMLEGERLRVVVSWDACPPSVWGNAAPSPVATDYDLLLHHETEGWLFTSQSLDDNNEGFDFYFGTADAGLVTVYLSWEDGASASSCNGQFERVAWAIGIGEAP